MNGGMKAGSGKMIDYANLKNITKKHILKGGVNKKKKGGKK